MNEPNSKLNSAILARNAEIADVTHHLRTAISLSISRGLTGAELIHVLAQEITLWSSYLTIDELESKQSSTKGA
jgi:hypothetical protein